MSASDWPHGLSAGVVDVDVGVCEAGGVGVLAVVEPVELLLELEDDEDDELLEEELEEPLEESSGAGSRDPGGAVSS